MRFAGPPCPRDEIRLEHRVRGNSITIYESRPLFSGTGEWTSIPAAQFRYDESSQKWTLYYADRNSKWHRYWDIDPIVYVGTACG